MNNKKSTIIKTSCAIGVIIALAILAVCCKTADSGESGASDTEITASAVQSENTPAPQNSKASEAAPQTESSEATTASVSTATATTTVTTSKEVTTTAASTTKPQTSASTAPKPLWAETECQKQLYITVDCYARKQAIIGSEAVRLMKFGEKVNAVALTDTGYYKLSDGLFVHSDYLSEAKLVTATAKPTSTTKVKPASTTVQTKATSTSKTDLPSPISTSEYEQEVFRLVNEIRRKNGLAEFKWDDAAYKVAKTRAAEITQSFSHTRPNGSDPYSLYGVSDMWSVFTTVGENIAAGQSTPADVVESWMNSEGHRANILNPNFENLAVGFVQSNDVYGTYWVQEFNTYR